MKNFPHQINDIPKLVAALDVFNNLLNDGQDAFDDGVFGYSLARAGVYTFRKPPAPSELEARIEKEKTKKKSDQGARTCARDLRNFFAKINAIEKSSTYQGITDIGALIISAGFDLSQRATQEIWQACLRNVEAVDLYDNISHPYIIILRLVQDLPGIERKKLAVALDALDDSETEYQRVLDLANNPDWYTLVDGSTAQKANAVKILPALAQQVGDVEVRNKSFFYPVNSVKSAPAFGKKVLFAAPRLVDANKIATIPTLQDDETNAPPTLVDYSSAAKLTRDRTVRHQKLVKQFAVVLERCGYILSENPMDCLGIKNADDGLLIEAKTISDSRNDEGKQVRLALGQLTYYERFFVDSNQVVQKIALFDSLISPEHVEYLERYNCMVLWKEKDIFTGSEAALQFCTSMGVTLV